MKISAVSLGRERERVPVPMLRFGTNAQNIHKIIKVSNLGLVLSVDCDIGSMPEVIQDICGITSGFDKPIGNTFFNH